MFDHYIGVIKALGFNFAPARWGFCGGQTLSINQFSTLFSLLGCRFGGDCRVSFGLPDLRGSVLMGQGTGPGLTPRFIGTLVGYEKRILTGVHMAAHTHSHSYSGGASANLSVHAVSAAGKKQTAADGDSVAALANNLGTLGANLYIAPGDVELDDTEPLGGVTPGTGGFESHQFSIQYTPTPTDYVNTTQSSQVVNYCICMDGLYPSRS